MSKNLYLNIIFSVIILLTGYYYSSITTDFWTGRIIGILSAIVSGFALIGFNIKNFPQKKNVRIKPIQIIAILIGFSGMILFIYFFQNLLFGYLELEIEPDFKVDKDNLVRFLILVVAWVFLEEIYFRRILAQKIYNKKGFFKALWISALIFCIGHWFGDTGLLYVLIGGLILAYVYLKTTSIWLTIFAHLYFNLMTFYITPKITERISEFNTMPKMTGITILGLILIFIMLFLIKYSTRNQT